MQFGLYWILESLVLENSLCVRDAPHTFVSAGVGLCFRGARERDRLLRGPREHVQRAPIEQGDATELVIESHDSVVLHPAEDVAF